MQSRGLGLAVSGVAKRSAVVSRILCFYSEEIWGSTSTADLTLHRLNRVYSSWGQNTRD